MLSRSSKPHVPRWIIMECGHGWSYGGRSRCQRCQAGPCSVLRGVPEGQMHHEAGIETAPSFVVPSRPPSAVTDERKSRRSRIFRIPQLTSASSGPRLP